MDYQLNADDRDLCEFDIWTEPPPTFAYGPPYDLISLCVYNVVSAKICNF